MSAQIYDRANWDDRPAQQAVLDLLTEWGLPVFEMPADGTTKDGFATYARDASGNKFFIQNADGEPETARDEHEWPVGFPVDDFLTKREAYIAEFDAANPDQAGEVK